MPIIDLADVPFELWMIFIGIFLFGLLLPMLTSHSLLKIFYTFKTEVVPEDGSRQIGFYRRLALGWLMLVPIYIWVVYYLNGKV